MWQLLCVKQVRKSFIFIQRNTYVQIETYIRPEDLESSLSPVDIVMEDTDVEEEDTPKPKRKVNYSTQLKSEDENSQIEIGGSDYVTPKAFQKKSSNFQPASDSDSLEITGFAVDQDWKSESESTNESDGGSDIYEKLKKSKLENKDKASNNSNVQEFRPRTIDLAKVQMKVAGAKAKRGLRMEVKERRAAITEVEGKNEEVRYCFHVDGLW